MNGFQSILERMGSPALNLSEVDVSSIADHGKWIMDSTFKIGFNCQELFEWFFRANEVPASEMPDFCCIPMMCELERNFRFRWRVLVDDEGVGYLCLVKRRDPVGKPTRYGLSYRILPSEKGRSVEKVEELMKALEVVDIVECSGDDPIQWNFYNTKEDAQRYVRTKWQTKHGVHMLDGRIRVLDSAKGDDVFADPSVLEGFDALARGWYAHRGCKGEKTDLLVPDHAKDIWRIMVFLLDGKVAGYCAITKFCGNWFSMMNKNSSKFADMDEYAARRIGHFITWYRHAEFVKDEEAEGLYCFGARKYEPAVRDWKRMTYGHVVNYTRRKISPSPEDKRKTC